MSRDSTTPVLLAQVCIALPSSVVRPYYLRVVQLNPGQNLPRQTPPVPARSDGVRSIRRIEMTSSPDKACKLTQQTRATVCNQHSARR